MASLPLGMSGIRININFPAWLLLSDQVHEILLNNYPEGFDHRCPGSNMKPRKPLVSIGPFEEIHGDGHEKLGSMALKIGAGLPIYGLKDKFSRMLLHLVVVPSCREATTIGHVYLDFVAKYGGERTPNWLYYPKIHDLWPAIPLQLTVDKGSETGDMWGFQVTLR
jgi:hypothetical protein